LIDEKGKIHYSTNTKDFTQKSPYERIYEKLETVDPAFTVDALLVSGTLSQNPSEGALRGEPNGSPQARDRGGESAVQDQALIGPNKFIIDAEGGRFIYSFPVYDSLNLYKGSAVFYVSVRDLERSLTRKGIIESSDRMAATPSGYILNADALALAELTPEIH
jgi:hypothetical protein